MTVTPVRSQAPQRTATSTAASRATTRDTSVDAIRAACLIIVVALHATMVGVGRGPHGVIIENALEDQPWFAPVSWIVQVMPLFFIAGGFSAFTQWQRMAARGASAGDYVRARLTRLLVPAIAMVATVGVGLTVLIAAGLPHELVATAGFRIGQPLWFLAVYLGCSAMVPLMVRAHERAPWPTTALLAAAVVTVDIVRLATGVQAVGFLNLALVWLLVQQLGFWLADGRVAAMSVRARLRVAGAAAAMILVLSATGLYSPDMYVNLNPPTLSIVLLGVIQLMLFSIVAPRIRAWMRHSGLSSVVNAIGSRAMTAYLWHMSVLVALAGLLLVSGLPLPHPLSFDWWASRPTWLVVVAFAVIAVVRVTERFETRRRAVAGQATGPLTLTLATLLGVAAVGILLVVGFTPATAAASIPLMLLAIRASETRQAA
ncbi:MAG TPA: acyltransferase [Microbacteriaceae bacterium]|nr:acyltransferase [Microbacteriaceae bacterium]